MLQIRLSQCTWHDLDAVYHLAESLARYFPKPDEVNTAIYELIINAIEHGTLGLGYEAKTQLLRTGCWHEEIRKRLASAELHEKAVTVTLERNETGCILSIADEGDGFAWQDFAGRKQSLERPNGRGLWIAFQSAFDEITFNPIGNVVTCRMRSQSGERHVPAAPMPARRA